MSDQRKTTAGDALGNAGAPLFLTYDGRQHPVAYPDLTVLDRTEKLVVRRAMDSIEALKDTLSPAEYEYEKKNLSALVRAGQHTTGGELWSQEFAADGGTRGLMMILWSCLAEGRSRLEPLEAAKLPEIAFDDVATVLAESPDAAIVVALVLPNFTKAVAIRRKLPSGPMLKKMEGLLGQLKPTEPSPPAS